MNIDFFKYSGTGNDFIIIDDRLNTFDLSDEILIKSLCERKHGIGADGLILLRNHKKYDFEMKYFNSDGKLGSMCGNGARCIVDFAYELGLINSKCSFLAYDGLHYAIYNQNSIALKMNDVKKVNVINNFTYLDTGSPHCVKFVTELDSYNVIQEGKKIRYNSQFNEIGVNVNFVEIIDDNISLRTYERGVENETLSCGTGAVAVALALHANNKSNSKKIILNSRGGVLEVNFNFNNGIYQDIWLIGNVSNIYKGKIKC